MPLICCPFLVSHLFVFYLESWLDTFLNELSRKMNLVKIFLAHLAALSCNIEEMRDTNKNKLVPNVAQERRQIMKFNLPILGSSPAGNSIQTETHKFSQTNSQPRPQIFTQPLKYHCVLHEVLFFFKYQIGHNVLSNKIQILSLEVAPILTWILKCYLELLSSPILPY